MFDRLQRSMIYPGTEIRLSRMDAPGGIEQLWIDTSVGSVEAWYMPPRGQASGRAILFTHGNYEVIDHYDGWFNPALDAGHAVMLVEYPGYGISAGTPTQTSVTEAVTGAYDRLVGEWGARDVVGWGRSLGGGAVCQLAVARQVRALILQSTVTSLRWFARQMLIPGFVVVDPYDNLAVVREFSGPTLVLHGARDEVIPVAHGRELASAAPDAKFVLMPGGHNDTVGDAAYWRTVLAFLHVG